MPPRTQDERWYVIDVMIGGRLVYVGKCFSTEEELRKELDAYLTIEGNHVVVHERPGNLSKRSQKG